MHRIPSSLRTLSIVVLAALLATGALILGPGSTGGAQTPTAAAASGPFTVEYYYKVRWGHFDEFMELYQRNHYPILQRQRQLGRIVSMTAAYPLYHASEGSRWDMRFTIVWKDAATAHDDFDASPIAFRLGATAQSAPDGEIDDVVVWNRVLSFAEMEDVYKANAPVGDVCKLR